MKRNVYYNKAKTIRYYGLQCATYKTGAMNCPNHKTISGQMLERKILEELNAIVKEYCQTDAIRLTDLHKEELASLEKRLTALENRRNAARNRLVSMYKDKLDGVISEADYALFRESLQVEEDALTAQTEELQKQLDECRKRQENAENRNTLLRQYTHFDHLDRVTADEFIDTVEIGTVSENGEREIHIHWKI